jgi:hypothetical protein
MFQLPHIFGKKIDSYMYELKINIGHSMGCIISCDLSLILGLVCGC